jgi:hypothetical protein
MAVEEDVGVEVAACQAYEGRAGSTRRVEVGWKGLLYHTMDTRVRSNCTDTHLFQSGLSVAFVYEIMALSRLCAKGYEWVDRRASERTGGEHVSGSIVTLMRPQLYQ